MGKWKRRGSLKGKRRWRVRTLINKYKGKCAACQVQVTLTHRARDQATVDHIVPRSKGGGEELSNLQLLCRECNEAKGDSLIDEYGELVNNNE